MATAVGTAWGCAIPPAPRHAITTHMPDWEMLKRFIARDPEIMASFKSFYPRLIIHPDIKELTKHILDLTGVEDQTCHIFVSAKSAEACKAFATSKARGENALTDDEITIRTFETHVPLFCTFIPAAKFPDVHPFWINTGTGISSRLAEECMKHIDLLHEVDPSSIKYTPEITPENIKIRERIAGLLERTPAGSPQKTKVSQDDVYLFQTGMASIYKVHQNLCSWKNSKTVLFGFAFHSTIHIFEDYGPGGSKFLGLGSSEQLDELEALLEAETNAGSPIQAVWAEFPSNPLLAVPDLNRLRKLADKYHFVLVIDETIGSYANVDVLPVADIIMTSLTKSFSGYADVMAGGAVLNPSSPIYSDLKSLFTKHHINDFSSPDAVALEHNSRDYLPRTTILNNNAAGLVEFFSSKAKDPKSCVAKVFYPTTNPTSLANFNAFMRPATADFTPGYGCLLSVEFASQEATIAFYNAADVHFGPHLGAHRTILMPYTSAIYGNELEWADKYGLFPTQLRVAVGLEDTNDLIKVFNAAIEAGNNAVKGAI